MELRHLRYFVAVAEERHFGRAAKRLAIAQPPLSRQIQELEAELGFPLFRRSRRAVEPTAAGEVMLEHARRIFASIDQAVHEAERASRGQVGRLGIGYPSSVAYSGLTKLLRAFREHAPGVEMVLREMPPAEQLDALKEGSIDAAFVRAPLLDPGYSFEQVRREPLVVVLPDTHPLARRKTIALPMLANEPFVLFPRSRGAAFFDQLISLCRAAGFSPKVAQEAPQLDVLSLVAAGFGVSILPESVREVARDGMVLRPIAGRPTTELLIAWRTDNGSEALREFLATVRRVGVRPARPKRRRPTQGRVRT